MSICQDKNMIFFFFFFFFFRLSLPEEWRGLRDDVLSAKSGIKDCIFVHASGFIGGNKTYDGVMEMARMALKNKKES